MTRAKDDNLGKECRAMTDAAVSALSWISDNERLVGARRQSLERSFKKAAVEARKHAAAAERPMSVGVFGASQAGKSFLIGGFIAPADNPVKILFGSGDNVQKLDFLTEVNPAGGDETTGLVTRFSINDTKSPSPEYPVVLRMLRESDIVKILANTFVLDLGGRPEMEIGGDALDAHFAQLESQAGDTALPGMEVEDVFELEDYLAQELEDHPIIASEKVALAFWQGLERLAPRLGLDARAEALSPLWGGIPEFTAVFKELKQALDTLQHPELAFAPLDAIRDRAKGILHVQTIYGLDKSDEHATAMVTLMTSSGATVALRKPVITALTAELKVTLEEKPWPFFEHTDLLDFPGARGREKKTAADFFRGEDAQPTNRSYCFLRGKIAVLFDKYSSDLDLNTMVLCADDRNHEVRQLAGLVERWIGRTHGMRADDRRDKRVALFLCLTKSDLLFDQKAGASAMEGAHARLNKDVQFFKSWMDNWTPGEPFDNVVFTRNPMFKREDLFSYEPDPPDAPEGYVAPEAGLLDGQVARLEAFKAEFQTLDIVKRHVADPAAKIDAVLAINDGGIKYLADKLAPTCDPDLKYDQILPRASSLSENMRRDFEEFYEAGDIAERVKERRGKAREVALALHKNPEMIGQFIAYLEASESLLGNVFMGVTRGMRDDDNNNAGPAASNAGSIVLDSDFLHDDDEPAPVKDDQKEDRSLATQFGTAAVEQWLQRLEDGANNAELVQSYGLEPEHLSTVVHELRAAARRYKIAAEIGAAVQPIIQFHQRPDEHRPRVALVSSLIINQLVNRLGRERAEDGDEDNEMFARSPAPAVGVQPDLPADSQEMLQARGRFLNDWLKALLLLAAENAASAEGGVVDVEQNRRLGELIEMATLHLGERETA